MLPLDKEEMSQKSYVRTTAHANDDVSMPPEERMLAMLSASLCKIVNLPRKTPSIRSWPESII